MALPAETGRTGFRYADLALFPEDNLRREIINGELIVTAAPATRHQSAVVNIAAALLAHQRARGGKVFPAPTDVYLSDDNVVEPDVLFVTAEHSDRVEDKYVKGPPDLVVEISSPSTRRLELVQKRDLYAQFGVSEYWYVDLDADRVEVYRLGEGLYGAPTILYTGQILDTPVLPGFTLSVEEALGN